MDNTVPVTNKYVVMISLGLVLISLFLLIQDTPLLFHTLAEMFSIVVASAVFVLAWNTQRFLKNGYLMFMGIAMVFVASLDLLHTLAYKNMGVFTGNDANLPTQLWIAGRYLQSISFLVAPFFLRRKVHVNVLLLAYAGVFLVLVLSIFSWGIFPDAYVEGQGLTPFKIASEYIISIILVGGILLLVRARNQFQENVLRLLVLAVGVSIISELAFTLYMDVFGLANVIGHFLKIVAFYLIYRAIVVTGLIHPFDLLFREIKQSENALRQAHDELEERVRKRTVEVVTANLALQEEIEERRQTEAELQKYREHLEELVSARTEELQQENIIRQRAEAEVRRYAEKLERSNRDLEDFAFIASHDLQEPLRKIHAFGDRLNKRLEDQLDEEEALFLDRILDAAQRMQEMINSLLAYSRVSTKKDTIRKVSLDEIVREVVSDLEVRIEQTSGQVEVGPLPPIEADPLQMRQLFQNLIGNGLKFHRQGIPPVVKVFAETCMDNQDGNGKVVIQVSDNGIGFDSNDTDRIFKPFHRLVSRSEFEGSGMGLAICRKIVERHQGVIQAESTPGVGTTFIFSLPVEQLKTEGESQPG